MADRVYSADRFLAITTTTGTGAYAIAAAVSAVFRTIGQAGGVAGRRYMYTVQDSLSAPSEFEEGEGIFAAGPPETLSRATIKASSNAGMAVNWGPGTKYIYGSIHADRAAILDTDGKLPLPNLPAGRISQLRRDTGLSFPADTPGDVEWDVRGPDTLGVIGAGGGPFGQFTIQEAGVYGVEATLSFTANPTGQRRLVLTVNGAEWAAARQLATADTVELAVSKYLALGAGDVVRVRAFQSSGGNLLLGGNTASTFSIVKIGG